MTGVGVPLPPEPDCDVVIYTRPLCIYCTRARSLLDRLGVPFRDIDVGGNWPARAWLREASGQRTVPQIFIRGRSIGGYRELAALHRGGQLAAMLG